MAAIIYGGLEEGSGQTRTPSLSVKRGSGSRVVLNWPADGRRFIPQSAPGLRGSNTVWSVSEPVIYLDEDRVKQTNSMSGAMRVYRLWQP